MHPPPPIKQTKEIMWIRKEAENLGFKHVIICDLYYLLCLLQLKWALSVEKELKT